MSESALSGPQIVFGQQPLQPNGQPIDYNAYAAPSLFYSGVGLLDPRYGYKADSTQASAIGFFGVTDITTVSAIPSTASTTIIAAAQVATSGTKLTLASASTTGLTVLSSVVQVLPSNNNIPTSTLAIEGTTGNIVFSTAPSPAGASTFGGGVQVYDPTKAVSRNIRVTTNLADSGYYLVSGYDIYGYPMSERISGTTNATGGTQSGKKAFKYVSSVLPTGTIASTSVSVGTGDVYGFPIFASDWSELSVVVGGTTIITSTGFVAPVTSAATSTTGDVRGTYALQTPSNGAISIKMFQSMLPGNMRYTTTLFGVTPA